MNEDHNIDLICTYCNEHTCTPPACLDCVRKGLVKCEMCERAVGETHFGSKDNTIWCMPCFYKYEPNEDLKEHIQMLQSMGEIEYYHEGNLS